MKLKTVFVSMKAHYASILLLVAVLIFGIVLIVSPTIAGKTLLIVPALALFVLGALKMVQYFRNPASKAVQGWGLSAGALMVLGSLALLLVPDTMAGASPILFGFCLFAGGVLKFQISFDLKRLLFPKWYVPLVFAVVSILLGWLTIVHPLGTGEAFMQWTGVSLILEALLDGAALLLFHRQRKHYEASRAG